MHCPSSAAESEGFLDSNDKVLFKGLQICKGGALPGDTECSEENGEAEGACGESTSGEEPVLPS